MTKIKLKSAIVNQLYTNESINFKKKEKLKKNKYVIIDFRFFFNQNKKKAEFNSKAAIVIFKYGSLTAQYSSK